MKRRIFTILSVVSLVLCVVFAVLWVRSYLTSDHIIFAKAGTAGAAAWSYRGVHVGHGGMMFGAGRETILPPAQKNRVGRGWYLLIYQSGPPNVWDGLTRNWLGFGYVPDRGGPPAMAWRYRQAASIPIWFLVMTFGLLPAYWLRSRVTARKRFRVLHGLCSTCGYDLRASEDSCPECGTPIPASHNNAMNQTGPSSGARQLPESE